MERVGEPVVLDSRFWSKTVEVDGPLPTPCRLWTAATVVNRRGERYGKFSYGGRTVLAHRVLCVAREGKALEEIEVVLHGCNNPLCVEHGSSGTQSDNMRQMVFEGRGGGFLRDRSLGYVRCKRVE